MGLGLQVADLLDVRLAESRLRDWFCGRQYGKKVEIGSAERLNRDLQVSIGSNVHEITQDQRLFSDPVSLG
jgi:hypothetical protein